LTQQGKEESLHAGGPAVEFSRLDGLTRAASPASEPQAARVGGVLNLVDSVCPTFRDVGVVLPPGWGKP